MKIIIGTKDVNFVPKIVHICISVETELDGIRISQHHHLSKLQKQQQVQQRP